MPMGYISVEGKSVIVIQRFNQTAHCHLVVVIYTMT